MYSVFIVDDEHIVLEGLRKKIDWENSRFTFAGEATDGELALSMIHEVKPDILITDIKMPFMDGLELARVLKKIQPWIRIIILSGHDEFDYAKQAISIGVEDYILKPFTHDEIFASLNKVAERLDKERQQIQDISRLKEELESNSVMAKNLFLTEVVLEKSDAATLMQKAQSLGIDLIARFYKVIVSDLRQNSSDTNSIAKTRARLVSMMNARDATVSFFISPERFVIILKGNSDRETEEDSYSVAEAVEHIVTQNLDCNVISAIGKTVEHLSQLGDSYSDANSLSSMTRFWNKSRIVSSDDVNKTSGGILSLCENDPLVDKLKYAGRNEIDAIVSQQMDMVKNNPQTFGVVSSYLLVDVIMAVSKLIEELGGDVKQVMPEVVRREFVDKAVVSEEMLASEIKRVLDKVLDFRDSKMQGRYGDVILKAKVYIEQNFASQDTCLNSVAEAVHLSPNHFSTIFSQECGITFIEFLTDVRIENAKKLLRETNMKGSDIAYECGFNDPHYFSFIFKKNTGMSPREYKNSCCLL